MLKLFRFCKLSMTLKVFQICFIFVTQHINMLHANTITNNNMNIKVEKVKKFIQSKLKHQSASSSISSVSHTRTITQTNMHWNTLGFTSSKRQHWQYYNINLWRVKELLYFYTTQTKTHIFLFSEKRILLTSNFLFF